VTGIYIYYISIMNFVVLVTEVYIYTISKMFIRSICAHYNLQTDIQAHKHLQILKKVVTSEQSCRMRHPS
jgi:hypothetical protein